MICELMHTSDLNPFDVAMWYRRDLPEEWRGTRAMSEQLLCDLDDIADGDHRVFMVGTLEFGVFRQGEQIYAWENRSRTGAGRSARERSIRRWTSASPRTARAWHCASPRPSRSSVPGTATSTTSSPAAIRQTRTCGFDRLPSRCAKVASTCDRRRGPEPGGARTNHAKEADVDPLLPSDARPRRSCRRRARRCIGSRARWS